jgi:hypothetical protein
MIICVLWNDDLVSFLNGFASGPRHNDSDEP